MKLITNEFAAEACKADGGWIDAHRPAPRRIHSQWSSTTILQDPHAENRTMPVMDNRRFDVSDRRSRF